MNTETQKPKVHYCFNCGEETEEWDELPNGRKIYCCGSSKCVRELREEVKAMQLEARDRAEEDGYSAYY